MPTVKVIQSVSHGRYHLHEGELRDDIAPGDVSTLKEMGFVEDHDGSAQTGVTDSQDETLDDLIGDGTKMDAEPQNKMQDAPENKGKKK